MQHLEENEGLMEQCETQADSLSLLRNLMYDTLTLENESQEQQEITAKQNMGVSISSGAKKDGVNIFQLQSVVSKRVTTNVVDALRLIDKLQEERRHLEFEISKREQLIEARHFPKLPPPKEPLKVTVIEDDDMEELPKTNSKLVDATVKRMAEEGITLEAFQKEMKRAFISEVISRHDTVKDAADQLDIKPQYLKRLVEQYEVE